MYDYFELTIMTEKEFKFTVQIPDDTNTTVRVYPGKKIRHLKHMEWTLIFKDMFIDLAKDKELNGGDIRVLCGLLSHLDYSNIIDIPQSKLQQELNIKQPHIAASIKKLIAKNYILILGQKGRQNVYCLNPHYGLRAKAEDKPMLDRSWEQRKKAKNEPQE